METIKPISTISWNTEEKLKSTLERLEQEGFIDFWAYIYHYAENDINEGKNHYHVFMLPSHRVNTKQLATEFDELDITNQKMIKVLPITTSKFDDWYLYSIHDTSYLTSKGQVRKYHYQITDVISSNFDFLNEMAHKIDRSKLNAFKVIFEAVENGEQFYDIVKSGIVPIQQINAFKTMYEVMTNGQTYRNGRLGHGDDLKPLGKEGPNTRQAKIKATETLQTTMVNPETGEVTYRTKKINEEDELPF